MIFDTHAHYDDKRYNTDRNHLLAGMKENNVGLILNVGADIDGSIASVDLADRYDFIYASVGVHPHDVTEMDENKLQTLINLTKHPKVAAFGEIGLDYHYDNSPRDIQKYWFERQLAAARELNLPVVIHNREAHADVAECLKVYPPGAEKSGVIHAYSGSAEMLRFYTDRGFYIAYGGVLTFKNAKKCRDALKMTPTDRLLIETDSPYLSPAPFRGERNDSSRLKYVLETAAEILGMKVSEVEEVTYENGKRLFGIQNTDS